MFLLFILPDTKLNGIQIHISALFSADDVAKRISTLRTQFTRLVKPARSGSAVVAKTGRQKWLLTTLSFLQPHVKKRSTVSNMQVRE